MEKNQQNKIDDVLEIVTYIKDNAASKDDLKPLATKEEVAGLKNEVAKVKTEVKNIDGKLNNLINSVDRLVKHLEDIKTEQTAMNKAIKRHENWIQQLADKLDVKLEYE